MRRISRTLAITAAALAAVPGSALAVTRTVDDDKQQCPVAAFTEIQAAITASAPGDRVLVCDGRYTENVTIGAGKDNLVVVADEIHGAIIRATNLVPAAGAIVRITDGVKGVRFNRFQIEGPGNGTLRFGVLVDGLADVAQLRNNYIRVIRNNTGAIQPGTGVGIGSTGIAASAGIVRDFANNRLERYVNDGVRISGAGSFAVLTSNKLTGIGEQQLVQNNGVVVENGARARLTGNRITGHGGIGRAFGVLFDAAATGSQANHNYIDDNETGLALQSTSQAIIRSNVVPRNDSGIEVDSTSTANRLEDNDAKTNTSSDCSDESVGTRTAGTANTWLSNRGVLVNRPGICFP